MLIQVWNANLSSNCGKPMTTFLKMDLHLEAPLDWARSFDESTPQERYKLLMVYMTMNPDKLSWSEPQWQKQIPAPRFSGPAFTNADSPVEAT